MVCKTFVTVGNEALTVVYAHSGEEHQIVSDGVALPHGFLSNLGPIKECGLELQKNQIVVNVHMETNLPGVFAAGGICTYDGK